jgi:signal transduction histidine kinase
MSLSPDLFADLVGEMPLAMPRPAASMSLTPQVFADLLVSSHILHNAAQQQLALLVAALDGGPRCVAAAGDNGIVLHARSDTALDDDRLPGARLFTDAEQAPLRGGRVVLFEAANEDDCDIIVPFFTTGVFGGAVGLRIPPARATRPVIAALLQTAQTMAAVVELQMTRLHHEQAVATIGHEIRQPLSALVTALDLMQRMSQQVPVAPLRIAQRQALQLARLVETLLDAARILGGRLQLHRHLVDLRTVLAAAVESIRADITAKHQELRWEMPHRPLWCVGDPERLQEVALNLLSNAHRYTPEGGTIEVTTAAPSDARVMFSVRDTGSGIDQVVREHMFKPFSHSASRKGMGLGLTISLGIVQAHDGTITVDSNEPDPGTTFRVELPGLLGRTRDICATVQRTRTETKMLIARARALRAEMDNGARSSNRGRKSRLSDDAS